MLTMGKCEECGALALWGCKCKACGQMYGDPPQPVVKTRYGLRLHRRGAGWIERAGEPAAGPPQIGKAVHWTGEADRLPRADRDWLLTYPVRGAREAQSACRVRLYSFSNRSIVVVSANAPTGLKALLALNDPDLTARPWLLYRLAWGACGAPMPVQFLEHVDGAFRQVFFPFDESVNRPRLVPDLSLCMSLFCEPTYQAVSGDVCSLLNGNLERSVLDARA